MLSKIHLLEKYLPEYFLSEMLAHEKALFLGCQHPQSIYSLCANLVLMLYEEYTLSAD